MPTKSVAFPPECARRRSCPRLSTYSLFRASFVCSCRSRSTQSSCWLLDDGGVVHSPRQRRSRVASRTSDFILYVRRHPLPNPSLLQSWMVVFWFFSQRASVSRGHSGCHGVPSAPGELVQTDVHQVSDRPRSNRLFHASLCSEINFYFAALSKCKTSVPVGVARKSSVDVPTSVIATVSQ